MTRFQDLADLMADTRPTLSGPVLAGGYTYKVTNTEDHHLVTAGGVKLYVSAESKQQN